MLLQATGERLAAQSLLTLTEGLETTWASPFIRTILMTLEE